LGSIFSSGYPFLSETHDTIERNGWLVADVPIQFYDRTSSHSVLSWREIAEANPPSPSWPFGVSPRPSTPDAVTV
jgi:hypothetical protein